MKYKDIAEEAESLYPIDSNRYHPTFERDEYIALNANNIKMKSCQQAHISAATAERERMMDKFIPWLNKQPYTFDDQIGAYYHNTTGSFATTSDLFEIFLKENK